MSPLTNRLTSAFKIRSGLETNSGSKGTTRKIACQAATKIAETAEQIRKALKSPFNC